MASLSETLLGNENFQVGETVLSPQEIKDGALRMEVTGKGKGGKSVPIGNAFLNIGDLKDETKFRGWQKAKSITSAA